MVEFISEAETVREEPPPLEEVEEPRIQESLEVLVENHTEELYTVHAEQVYVDEPSEKGDYQQPNFSPIGDFPDLKEELKPLAYEENERLVVVDIFERYGKKQPIDDKWWLK